MRSQGLFEARCIFAPGGDLALAGRRIAPILDGAAGMTNTAIVKQLRIRGRVRNPSQHSTT